MQMKGHERGKIKAEVQTRAPFSSNQRIQLMVVRRKSARNHEWEASGGRSFQGAGTADLLPRRDVPWINPLRRVLTASQKVDFTTNLKKQALIKYSQSSYFVCCNIKHESKTSTKPLWKQQQQQQQNQNDMLIGLQQMKEDEGEKCVITKDSCRRKLDYNLTRGL